MCFQAHLRRFQNLLLAGEAPPNFRYECILGRQLFKEKKPAQMQKREQFIKAEDIKVKISSIRAMEVTRMKKFLAFLVEKLNMDNKQVKIAVIQAFGDLHENSTFEFILRLLSLHEDLFHNPVLPSLPRFLCKYSGVRRFIAVIIWNNNCIVI
jgi:hypothetical protein